MVLADASSYAGRQAHPYDVEALADHHDAAVHDEIRVDRRDAATLGSRGDGPRVGPHEDRVGPHVDRETRYGTGVHYQLFSTQTKEKG